MSSGPFEVPLEISITLVDNRAGSGVDANLGGNGTAKSGFFSSWGSATAKNSENKLQLCVRCKTATLYPETELKDEKQSFLVAFEQLNDIGNDLDFNYAARLLFSNYPLILMREDLGGSLLVTVKAEDSKTNMKARASLTGGITARNMEAGGKSFAQFMQDNALQTISVEMRGGSLSDEVKKQFFTDPKVDRSRLQSGLVAWMESINERTRVVLNRVGGLPWKHVTDVKYIPLMRRLRLLLGDINGEQLRKTEIRHEYQRRIGCACDWYSAFLPTDKHSEESRDKTELLAGGWEETGPEAVLVSASTDKEGWSYGFDWVWSKSKDCNINHHVRERKFAWKFERYPQLVQMRLDAQD